jgi:hypothetical protein
MSGVLSKSITNIQIIYMANIFPLNKIEAHFKEVLNYAPGLLGNDAVNFFLDSFKRQGWAGWAIAWNHGLNAATIKAVIVAVPF